ncbi:MAG: DUF4956 domain-containing protein [Bacteroidia bacterium]|nr:DUF4956 domain-containing protein [Bacteroidia bacterium]
MILLQALVTEPIITDSLEALVKITTKISWRLLIDLASVFVLVRFIYYPTYKHRELFFTFFILNLIIFLISFLLNKVDLSMGAAFGLFAVFSMLRYRTENISNNDMSYLFLCIALGLVSAVAKIKGAEDAYEYLFLGGINAVIILITYLLESKHIMKRESSKIIVYENIEMIKANKNLELMQDISTRAGINVHRYGIQKIDFLKDAAYIKVYYYEV